MDNVIIYSIGFTPYIIKKLGIIMSSLLSENWIEKVTLNHFASPPKMTTLKFGEKQMVAESYANISRLAIKFPKSWELFKSIKGGEHGNIMFGVLDYDDEITSDFSIRVKKEVIDFFNANCNKLSSSRNKQFYQTIQEKFGLEMEFCPLDNTIYFNLFSDTDQTIDFGELANMVFKQIGLVG